MAHSQDKQEMTTVTNRQKYSSMRHLHFIRVVWNPNLKVKCFSHK